MFGSGNELMLMLGYKQNSSLGAKVVRVTHFFYMGTRLLYIMCLSYQIPSWLAFLRRCAKFLCVSASFQMLYSASWWGQLWEFDLGEPSIDLTSLSSSIRTVNGPEVTVYPAVICYQPWYQGHSSACLSVRYCSNMLRIPRKHWNDLHSKKPFSRNAPSTESRAPSTLPYNMCHMYLDAFLDIFETFRTLWH